MSYEESEDIDHLIDEELVEYTETDTAVEPNDDVGPGRTAAEAAGEFETLARATIPLADATVNTLRKHLIHGKEPMKRAAHGNAFTHCQAAVPIAEEYNRLRELLSEHACLELQKDVIGRIRQFEIFIRNLKKLVQEETASWQAINHPAADGRLEDHQTNLTALSSICDEFRMHLNHWICIKHRVQSNRWLRASLPSLLSSMDQICQRFVRLQETAFWWTEKLLKTGMQVFAYVDRRSLTYNDVFSIVRGIEEYNTLIQLVRLNTHEMRLSSHKRCQRDSRKNTCHLVQRCQFSAIDSGTTKSLHFLRLLHSLAHEWAKSAVAMTRHFLDDQQALLDAMQSSKCLHVDEPTVTAAWLTPSVAELKRTADSPQLTTSDYYSESHNKRDQAALVDITGSASPLLDFGKKEKEYISKVIQITCQRTTLLRKSKHVFHSSAQSSLRRTDSLARANETVILEEPSESFIRQDSKRKSVSWGDSHDMSVCRQLITKYNDALWKAFAEKLEDSFNHELCWSKLSSLKCSVGCLDLCSSGAVRTFIESLNHASMKGYFTNAGSQQVSHVLGMLKARADLVSCDVAISRCLSSMQTGKAEAILLHDGRKSTRTAMLLRNAIILARSQLPNPPCPSQPLAINRGSPSHQNYVDCRIRANIVRRLQTIISLVEKWCKGKAEQFLHSYKVAAFVLIIHGDLVILHKELLAALQLVHKDVFDAQLKVMETQLEKLAVFHVDMKDKLTKKAIDLSHEILIGQMPRDRTWRISGAEGELEVHGYAESIVDQVLVPVANGAKHLCADDQVSAVETIINAVCKTWLEYILKHKIKFSVRGAAQLEKDFEYIRDFIGVYFNDESVKLRIIKSAQMHRFNAIIKLLADNPAASNKPTISTSLSSRNRVGPMEVLQKGEMDYEQLEDKAHWVALRAGTPFASTIFPCLNKC